MRINKSNCIRFQVVVEKGWQGVTYVLLDRLEVCGVKYAAAVEVRYSCTFFVENL